MDEIAKLKFLRRTGLSFVAIAVGQQVDLARVYEICGDVQPLRQIPDLPNLPPPAGYGPKISVDRQRKIKDLRKRGYSLQKIAQHLGENFYTVKKIGAKVKLPELEKKK